MRRGSNLRSRKRNMSARMPSGDGRRHVRSARIDCKRVAGPAHTKAPEGTGGDLRSTGPVAANKSTVTGRRRVPRSPALRPANLVPGTVPRITPRTGLAVQPAPSGKTKCTAGAMVPTTGLSTNLQDFGPKLSPKLTRMWTVCGYTRLGRLRMGRLLARLMAAQDRLGAAVRRLQSPLAERPVPAHPSGQGLPERHVARPPAPRGGDRHPDRHPPADGHPRSSPGRRPPPTSPLPPPSCSCWPPP